MWSAVITCFVRIGHLYHDKHIWAYPLLLGEIAIAECGMITMLFGFLPIARDVDLADPVLDMPWDIFRLAGLMALDETVDGKEGVRKRANGIASYSEWAGLGLPRDWRTGIISLRGLHIPQIPEFPEFPQNILPPAVQSLLPASPLSSRALGKKTSEEEDNNTSVKDMAQKKEE